MKAFPKIFAMGTKYIKDILEGEVEVTEKVDGSQFGFGLIDGEVMVRSKGKEQPTDNPDKMFSNGINYILSIKDKLPEDLFFYAEYLSKPRHNNLAYDAMPTNHLALFAITDHSEEFTSDHKTLEKWAKKLDIGVVPLIFRGETNPEELAGLLDKESYLGGVEMEGFVVKNYAKTVLIGDRVMPLMAGKFVGDKYKEVAKGWHKEHTSKGKWELFKQAYRTEARWEKAMQHLRDNGKLLGEPRDIGGLVKEVHTDITTEEKEIIKDFLWGEFGADLLRTSTAGLPEWYKKKLMMGDK